MELRNSITCLILLATYAVVSIIVVVEAVISEKDLILSPAQKKALDKFKRKIDPLPVQDYRKKEISLIKWLRVANFDPDLAIRRFKNDMIWRDELRMDTIHDEDWSNFNSKYEYNLDSVDKKGQPVLIVDIGVWDFRQALLSGQREKLFRYVYKMFDETGIKLRKLQEQGKSVTRTDLIVNLDGWSTIQQGCVSCITFYVTLAIALDPHFPEMFDELILINTPSIFEVVLNAVKPFLPKELQTSMHIFGQEKRVWKKYLRNIIDLDQLPFELGGNKFD